jgi:hypothetical protein
MPQITHRFSRRRFTSALALLAVCALGPAAMALQEVKEVKKDVPYVPTRRRSWTR